MQRSFWIINLLLLVTLDQYNLFLCTHHEIWTNQKSCFNHHYLLLFSNTVYFHFRFHFRPPPIKFPCRSSACYFNQSDRPFQTPRRLCNSSSSIISSSEGFFFLPSFDLRCLLLLLGFGFTSSSDVGWVGSYISLVSPLTSGLSSASASAPWLRSEPLIMAAIRASKSTRWK